MEGGAGSSALVLFVDFGELGVNDLFLAVARLFARTFGAALGSWRALCFGLLSLVHRFAELHRGLRQSSGLLLHLVGIAALDSGLGFGERLLDLRLDVGGNLVAMPNAEIAKSIAPFPAAIGLYWGGTAATLAALAMAISAFGTLNASLLGCGEMLYSLSLRGDVPKVFARNNRFNAPWIAQLTSAAIGFVLLALNASKGTTQLFTFITLLAADSVLYLYSAAAIAAAIKDRRASTTVACAIGLTFVLYAFYGSGLEAFLLSLAVLGSGLFIFLFRRRSLTSPAPELAPAAPLE